jgi:hypothetical protein
MNMDFENDLYEAGVADDAQMVHGGTARNLSGTMRPGALGRMIAAGDVSITGRLSGVPGGIDLMADWLRTQVRDAGGAPGLSVSFPLPGQQQE